MHFESALHLMSIHVGCAMPRDSERCRECKNNIARLLEEIYGQVIQQYDLGLPARLEGYKSTACFDTLALIYASLQNHRCHRSFVRTNRLPKVDYFLPGQHMVVEFDESQHFTRPRHISLSSYPAHLRLGYNRQRWIALAAKLDCHDNDPPYRDEQRAWYDTLRDFSSIVLGNAPTVRLYARDMEWCTLDPDKAKDIDLFFNLYFKNVQSAW